jgi:exodeoxyribonuclease VII large subunit
MDIAGHTILTITQVSNQVKFVLERDYSNLWIQGEIASCKPYPSGHIYLTLKDGQSELSAVVFAQYVHQLSNEPKIGQKVTVNGS